MKKLSLAILMSLTLAACTANVYTDEGNASVVSTAPKGTTTDGKEVVELTLVTDDGQEVVMLREYDAHVTVGSRVTLTEDDLNSLRRFEFK